MEKNITEAVQVIATERNVSIEKLGQLNAGQIITLPEEVQKIIKQSTIKTNN